MSFPKTSLRRWLSETFVSASPLVLSTKDELRRFKQELQDRCSALDGVRLSDLSSAFGQPSERLFAFSLQVDHPTRYYGYTMFSFELNDQRELFIQPNLLGEDEDIPARPVGSLDEVLHLLRVIGERRQRLRASRAKRDKVRHLKTKVIRARIKQLARDNQFEFATEETPTHLKVYFRWAREQTVGFSESEGVGPARSRILEIRIPFRSYEATLAPLPDALMQLRRLSEQGVSLHTWRGDKLHVSHLAWNDGRPTSDLEGPPFEDL